MRYTASVDDLILMSSEIFYYFLSTEYITFKILFFSKNNKMNRKKELITKKRYLEKI